MPVGSVAGKEGQKREKKRGKTKLHPPQNPVGLWGEGTQNTIRRDLQELPSQKKNKTHILSRRCGERGSKTQSQRICRNIPRGKAVNLGYRDMLRILIVEKSEALGNLKGGEQRSNVLLASSQAVGGCLTAEGLSEGPRCVLQNCNNRVGSCEAKHGPTSRG